MESQSLSLHTPMFPPGPQGGTFFYATLIILWLFTPIAMLNYNIYCLFILLEVFIIK